MHSSRMPTTCLLAVSPSMYYQGAVPARGRCVPAQGGVPGQVLPPVDRILETHL